MKVLYVLHNYPQASESYVDAEIEYVRRHDVEVEIWSPVAGFGEPIPNVPIHRGSLRETVVRVRPNLIHIHHLIAVERALREIPAGIPVTVRAHSFDWDASKALSFAVSPSVRAVYTFPHFVEKWFPAKIVSLPVAFDPSPYLNSVDKDRRLVLRTAAGLPTKALEDFLDIGRLVPEARFVLSVCPPSGDRTYVNSILPNGNRLRGGRVEIHTTLERPGVVGLVRQAGIYVSTNNPGAHPFGMPISIAESLATGACVLARDSAAAREYLGPAGFFYRSSSEAAGLIRSTFDWTDDRWSEVAALAQAQSMTFTADTVLPRLVDDWKRFVV